MNISTKQKSPKKTSGTRQPRKRKYDNSKRSQKSESTQHAIITALVELLTERRGGNVNMEEIAERLGISERTIFRFFKDKETLHLAMDEYLFTYLRASVDQMKDSDFIGFGKNAFEIFDRNEALVMAYLFSPFGQEARHLFRKKLNKAMIEKILQERKLSPSVEREKRLALVASLVNAKIWYDVRADFGYTGAEMRDAVEWALKTLIDHC